MGFELFNRLKKLFPEQDPFTMVKRGLFYWFSLDLTIRFFLQKLPVMTVKPFLTMPVKRNKVVNFVLTKSASSFLSLFFAIPFAIVLLREGYHSNHVLFLFLQTLVQ